MTLRGQNYGGPMALEVEAARKHGLKFVRWSAKARRVVSAEAIQDLISILRTVETPNRFLLEISFANIEEMSYEVLNSILPL